MNSRSLIILMGLSLGGCSDEQPASLPGDGAVTEEPASGSDGGGSVEEETSDGESIDLGGGLELDGISHLEIAYYEGLDDVCVYPNQMYLVAVDTDRFPLFSMSLPFYSDPSGTYAIGDSVYGVNGIGEDNQARYDVILGVIKGTAAGINVALSGEVTVSVDAELGVAEIRFTDLIFQDDESFVHAGSLTLDLQVGCALLREHPETAGDGIGCGWMPQRVPYTAEFCQEITSEYPADVLR